MEEFMNEVAMMMESEWYEAMADEGTWDAMADDLDWVW